ncbi:MAG: hypothetical protein V4521_00500 [Pseudomonadota bacterium]
MVMRWLGMNLWRALALALAGYCLLLVVQIHGLPIAGGGLKAALQKCQEGRAAIITAVKEADALAEGAREDQERRSAADAQRSDAGHDQDLESALAAGRSFADHNRIAPGGVRTEAAGSAGSKAFATAESDRAGFPSEMSAGALVAVSDPDLQACTAAVTYAVAAHNWAQMLDGNTKFDEASR